MRERNKLTSFVADFILFLFCFHLFDVFADCIPSSILWSIGAQKSHYPLDSSLAMELLCGFDERTILDKTFQRLFVRS